MECISMTVQVRNCEFDIDVYAKVSSGGSASWGSDEPPWFDVDIFDIYNPMRNRSVSIHLYEEIINLYENSIYNRFENEYR